MPAGTIANVALRYAVERDAAEHELRIQPVAALLEVAPIRELCDEIGRAEQSADHDVLGVVELDLLERNLVTGVVNDARDHRHELVETDLRQIPLEEEPAARHVRAGELRPVLGVVVEQ